MYRVNNFFEDWPEFREYLDEVDYSAVRSPVDGIIYPGLSDAIPEKHTQRVKDMIGNPKWLFLRLSPKGTPAPHQAHEDTLMGHYTMIIFLNRQEDCHGGTSILQHKNGMNKTPFTEEQIETWRKDTNNPNKWRVTQMFNMEENTMVVYPSKYIHRAEPVGGFGDVPRNARLVMVGFFDEIKIS